MIATPDCPDLSDQVDLLYGNTRDRAFNLSIETAREFLLARLFEKARKLYAKALEFQPRNWALLEGQKMDHVRGAPFHLQNAPSVPSPYKERTRFSLAMTLALKTGPSSRH